MKIGVLGAGMMTEALAAGWVRAGHDVLIGGRTPAKAAALAERIGARAGSLREAAGFGDAVLVAVRLAGLEETLRAAGAPEGTLAGKTVIDCGNAVDVSDFSQVTFGDGTSMAEEVARLSPGAHVQPRPYRRGGHLTLRAPRAALHPVAGFGEDGPGTA